MKFWQRLTANASDKQHFVIQVENFEFMNAIHLSHYIDQIILKPILRYEYAKEKCYSFSEIKILFHKQNINSFQFSLISTSLLLLVAGDWVWEYIFICLRVFHPNRINIAWDLIKSNWIEVPLPLWIYVYILIVVAETITHIFFPLINECFNASLFSNAT